MPVLTKLDITLDMLAPPETLARLHAEQAIAEREKLILAGKANPKYITYVDGVRGGSEANVKVGGVIRYVFAPVSEPVTFALAFLITGSPLGGPPPRFVKNWKIVVNGSLWTGEIDDIPSGSTVMLFNVSDYARRLEQGHRGKPGRGHKLIEKARQATQRAYPLTKVVRAFIDIPNPYILKTASKSRRKDRAKGVPITYPALILQPAT